MSTRRPPRRNPQHRSATARPAVASSSQSTSLVIIDASARRRKERDLYARKAREIERETLKLHSFENEDIPAFRRWIESEFAETLVEIRTSTGELEDLTILEGQVRWLSQHRGISLAAAYSEVREARQNGTLADLLREGREEEERKESSQEEDLRSLFEELFGDDPYDGEPPFTTFDDEGHEDGPFAQGAGARFQHDQGTAHSSRESAAERLADDHLKALYRQLVRILHPDAGDATPVPDRERLWIEVQTAYQWGDIQRLERLHAQVCRSTGDSPRTLDFSTLPIGDIIALRRPLEKRLRQIRAQLREARQTPMWSFGEVQKKGGRPLTRLRYEIGLSFADELAEIKDALADVRRQMTRWERSGKAQTERVRKSQGRRSR